MSSDEFAWLPLAPGSRPHFSSPRFTELAPQRGTNGVGESPPLTNADIPPFDRAVLSWNGGGGAWRLEMRLEIGGGDNWTPYYTLGAINGARQRSASPDEQIRGDTGADNAGFADMVSLELDTLAVKPGAKPATGFQVRATRLGGDNNGELRSLGVAHYRRDENRYTDRPIVPGAWDVTLPVPQRAQRDVEEEKQIGGEVCSPTSLAMTLDYYGVRLRTIDVARAVYDDASRIYGNWPCNTGAAARLLNKKGAWAAVVKMSGWDEVEREIAARRPVIISHRWNRGDLTNAPVSRSNGHLIVVVGFTRNGDVVVNDPAAKAPDVRRIYRRRELFTTWQVRGEGIAYLVHPA